MKPKEIDFFEENVCIDCGLPCHFGSGRFVNRYSVYGDVDGWRCGECASDVDELLEVMKNLDTDKSDVKRLDKIEKIIDDKFNNNPYKGYVNKLLEGGM